MDLKEITKILIEHLSNINDEQFEKELIEAGIERCPDITGSEEILPVYEVEHKETAWGYSIYFIPKGGMRVNVKGVA